MITHDMLYHYILQYPIIAKLMLTNSQSTHAHTATCYQTLTRRGKLTAYVACLCHATAPIPRHGDTSAQVAALLRHAS